MKSCIFGRCTNIKIIKNLIGVKEKIKIIIIINNKNIKIKFHSSLLLKKKKRKLIFIMKCIYIKH